LYRQAGIPSEAIEQVATWNKEARSRFITKLDVNSVISLQGDETFKFASGELEVIHTPGHTPGHICLFEPERKVLFSGDHLLANISPNPILELTPDGEGRNKSLLQYLESLVKITQKSPASIYPGHGRPFSDYPEVLDRFFHYFRQREEAVYQLMEQRGKTAYAVAGQLYPGAQGIDVFLGVSKAMGHLDILVKEGRVGEQKIEGVSYFSLYNKKLYDLN
jgi:glyoxylase-like metal-dependent hydrolase (beta-lactamase superfamily II)